MKRDIMVSNLNKKVFNIQTNLSIAYMKVTIWDSILKSTFLEEHIQK